MAFNPFKILKGLIIRQEGTLTPSEIEITPGGSAGTKTSITSSQTANRSLDLPDASGEVTVNDATQTLSNKLIDADQNTITNIENADIKVGAAIDAEKIADGTVTNTEFQYLSGVTSDIQTQLNTNATDIANHISDTSDAHDASAISVTPSGNLTSTDTQSALVELQTQLDTVETTANNAATRELDNLTTTAINVDLLPDSNNLRNIGSSSLEYSEIFVNNVTGNTATNVNTQNKAGSTGAISIYTGSSSSADSGDVLIGSGLAATTRGQVILDGSQVDVSNTKIVNVAAPTANNDAANKEYVDSVAAGLDPKQAVRVATTAPLGGSYATTPSNGRFTGAATSVDGVTLVAGDRVLVKDQVDQKQNGIYVYDGAGQYTRSPDMDGSPAAEVSAGNYTFATQGTTNVSSGFVLTGNGIFTLNTDNLVFTQFSGSGGASRNLDNLLAPTAINQDLLPGTNNTRNLGSNSLKFANAFIETSLIVNGNISTEAGNDLNIVGSTGLNLNSDQSVTMNAGPGFHQARVATSSSTASTGPVRLATGASTVSGNTGNVELNTGDATSGNSGNIALQTGTSAGGTRGSVTLNARSTQVASGALNIQQGQTSVPTASQQSLTIPSSGDSEGVVQLTASDSSVRNVLAAGPEGLPQAQNLIQNGDAEGKLISSTSIFVPYADAAQSSPVDGTGGTPNVTSSVTATTPLSGSKSYLLVKDAVNRQGQGWAIPFTVNQANRARVLSIKFDYMVSSGTFVAGTSTTDSDVTVWIYDVTNAQLIQPSSFRLLSNSTSIVDQFQAEFQTSVTGSSYRLIFHCATTSAAAYTLEVDNVIVSPSEYVFGSPISDPVDAGTMTIGGTTTGPTKGTTSTDKVTWHREGKFAVITYDYRQTTGGTAGTGDYLWSLPSGLAIDTTYNPTYTGVFADTTAMSSRLDATGRQYSNVPQSLNIVGAFPWDSTRVRIAVQSEYSGTGFISSSLANLTSAAYGFSFTIKVPIAGWSSSVQMADSTSTRVVAVHSWLTSNQSVTANVTNIPFNGIDIDTHAAFSNGVFTCPVPGIYEVRVHANETVNANYSLFLYRNGTVDRFIAMRATSGPAVGVTTIQLKSGDTLSVRSDTNQTFAGTATQTTGNSSYLSLNRISGPAQIASSEKICASYWLSANQAVTANTTRVNFDSRIVDTHNAVTTGASWSFRAPSSGTYRFSVSSRTISTAVEFQLFKNGSAIAYQVRSEGGVYSSGTVLDEAVAGDTYWIIPLQTVTIAGGARTAAPCLFNVERIGGMS